MKISNMKNLADALKTKEKEIEVYGEINDIVLKSGIASTLIFFSFSLFLLSITSSIICAVFYLIITSKIFLIMGVVALCIAIFTVTLILTIRIIQKPSIPLALKLHKYRLTKKNNRIILINKGAVK